MSTTRLALFGTLRLAANGQTITLSSAPTAALLGYLALHATQGRAAPRPKLASVLWPDTSELRARRMLSETLYRLRRFIGSTDPWLQADGATIALVDVQVDVQEFQALATAPDLERWQAAIDLYQGDLLPDLDAEWLLAPRLLLREQYLHTLAKICGALARNARFAAALAYAQRWALADPFNEDAHRAAIRLYARLGRYAEALQQYDRLVLLLDTELQTAPHPDTRALANTIRNEYHALPPLRSPVQPLIGRGAERAMLLTLVEQAQEGRGGLALVEGEPGIGKTRLLKALAEGAAWRGLTVVWGNRCPGCDSKAYDPLDQALRQLLSNATLVQALWGAESQESGRLERAIGARLHAEEPSTLSAWELIGPALERITAITPHVFLLDDVQDASPVFWETMKRCAAHLPALRLLIVLSYRSAALRSNRLAWQALCGLDRALVPTQLGLHGLAPDDCAEVARVCGAELDGDAVQLLQRRTGGNPALIRAITRATADETASALPGELLAQLLAQLAPPVYAALEAAAVLGHRCSLSAWCALAGPALRDIAPILISQGLMVQIGQGCAFAHGMLREHLYANIVPDRRRILHLQAAQALGAEGAAPEVLGAHFMEAGAWPDAVYAYRNAGDEANRAGDYAAAQAHYERASRLATRLANPEIELRRLQRKQRQVAEQEAHWRARHPPAAPLTVYLARLDAPLGRTLEDDEQVAVRWTVDNGPADAAVLRNAGKVALRRQRLSRLIAEALAQGAIPTDADLARALGVTERTIEADIAALRAAGQNITTRRRKRASKNIPDDYEAGSLFSG